METCRKFETPTGFFAHAEFYDFRTDNFLRIERAPGGAVVRALRDNLSNDEKNMFIRRLALEGFAPTRLQWLSPAGAHPPEEIKWVIDGSWVTVRLRLTRIVSRFLRPAVATVALFALVGLIGFVAFGIIERENARSLQSLAGAQVIPLTFKPR